MRIIASNSINKQRGVSKFGLLILAILITGFFTIGLKVGPVYIDHNLITGICQDMIDSGEATNLTIAEVRERVSNTLRINNVVGFNLNNIRMSKETGNPVITIAYERRVEMFGNLDVIASFDTVLQ
ncbi:MAG: DUF4845 domain-containing protein [Gammaproteobacteria bacterium]